MDNKSPVPLWLVLCVGAVLLSCIYLLGQPTPRPQVLRAGPSGTTQSPTIAPGISPASPQDSASATTSIGQFLRQDKTTYFNNYYGYSLRIPEGWRLATDYMNAWNTEVGLSGIDSASAEYVVVTLASVDIESRFVQSQFSHEPRGEYGFAPGQTVFIVPSPLTIEHSRQLLEAAASNGTKPEDTLQAIRVSAGDGLIFRTKPTDTDIVESFYIPCKSSQLVRSSAQQSGLASLILRVRLTGSTGDEIERELANSVICGSR
jgi:hypothetical protein